MSYQKLYVLDRASFLLDAQLLSSQTVGTFTGSTASVLGTQSWNMPAGYKAILTIENEQVLVSAMSILAGTVTCTIDTRGYNGTSAATHAAGTLCEIHLTKAHVDNFQDEIAAFNQGYVMQAPVTTVVSANQHTIATDQTAIFTVGRILLFKVGVTWYRAAIRSSSFGGGITTINITGDALPGAGPVVSAGFEFFGSVNKAVDYLLIKEAANVPGDNPPAGYSWIFAKGKGWFMKDSDGKTRFLCVVRATSASAAGILTLDWSLANVYDVTLTENITAVTHQNGVEGEEYILRIKQHASAAKTVVLGTAGGTRFSDSISTYVASTVLSAYDLLSFCFNATDVKYDLVKAVKGFSASPSVSGATATIDDVRKNVGLFLAGENINPGEPVYVKQATSVGPTICGTGVNDASIGSGAWSNPGNITASDDNRASISVGQHGEIIQSNYLKATNFGFNIPINATIQGIKFTFERHWIYAGANSTVSDVNCRVVKADASIGSVNKAASPVGWTQNADTNDDYGSLSDLWGEIWTPANINNANFGVVLSIYMHGTDGAPATTTANVDSVKCTIWYYVDGEVWRASASTTTVKGFCGLALEAKNAGEQIRVSKPGGICDSQNNLERGKFYYISNTTGVLQQSAGAVSARVGLALSKTDILVMHDVAP